MNALRMPRALLCLCMALAATACAHDLEARAVAEQGTLQVAFSPWDNIEKIIVSEIGKAQSQVLVQAYLLTSKPIAAALIAAHRRGVNVQALVDADQAEQVESSKAKELVNAGISVWLDDRYENAHNKVIVIDAALPRATVITGSYNFTWTAQHRNAENVLVVRNNPELAARYALNWNRHRADAKQLTR